MAFPYIHSIPIHSSLLFGTAIFSTAPQLSAQRQTVHLVIEEEVDEARDTLGELCELPHRFHRGALAAVEDVHADLLVGRRAVDKLVPHQAVLRLPQ